MPNQLKLTAENADELLNAGAYGAGAVIQVQSGTAEAGPFADDGTVALVSGTRLYTYYDADGTSSTWYRTRFENAAGTTASDWATAFQVGSEEAGRICSLYDVTQRLTGTVSANDQELLLEFIAEATTDIQGYTSRRFVRSPLSGSSTFLFDVATVSRTLWVPQGIATLTTLEVATTSQPETGGTYTTAAAADWFLRPTAHERDSGWPATRIVIRDNPTGAVPQFYVGYNVVRLTGALGWASVPADIAGLAVNAVIRRYQARGSGVATALGSEDFGARILRWVSPEEREKLDWYRVVRVA